MKLTSLLQLVTELQQAGKIDNLQQTCGVFGCVEQSSGSTLLKLISSAEFYAIFLVYNWFIIGFIL